MVELFESLVGDLSGYNPDVVFVMAAVFFLFVLTAFTRILELMIDFIFRRKR